MPKRVKSDNTEDNELSEGQRLYNGQQGSLREDTEDKDSEGLSSSSDGDPSSSRRISPDTLVLLLLSILEIL